ncbi:serine/threonine protein kinase [Nocardia cyriacigeorgica]|uniref:serine/threonine-protein kinase n=1 Tax=Nocardia cyriacigeorgica TaxID=135487 RepID=UPI00189555DE|nr:serine/threonine-protein kinase [Nocardia cyriacigeorgica]MBF6083608.1 serine/threonine protein kinase [Nocardia cyriacigeorgica]
MPLRPGAIIGGYRILHVLGSGGMGTVYLAQNPILPRQDALKVLSPDLSTDAEFRARFEREANLAAALDHANLVAVYNRGEEDGQLWIAMQYVDGTDAAQEAKKGPQVMTPQRALRIVSEIGKGLDYAHRRGLLHRDVKPANFLLSRSDDGDEERVFLTDFGVAKSAEDGQDLTRTGNFMATVAYAPPEQLVGEALDHRADIYSLGCSFYKLLTGQNPYPSTMPAVVMMGHIHEPPPRLTSVRPDLPPALDRVIAKVMAKSPEDRYGSCREFVQDAEAALFGRVTDRAPETGNFPTAPNYAYSSHSSTTEVGVVEQHRPPSDQTTMRRSPSDPLGRQTFQQTPVRKRRSGLLAAVGLVTALLVAFGAYLVVGRDDAAGATDLAAIRTEHPEFTNKTVAAYNISNSSISVTLDGSDQAKFLRDIGFRYSDAYQPIGAEKSPRTLQSGFSISQPVDVVLAIRSDSAAGNGGLRGLPPTLLNASATIVVIDEPEAVQAYRVWTEQSTQTLVDRMVPALAKALG